MLDPTLARTYVGRIVFAGLCDKLFDINEKLEIVPQLATGYEWADPKTLVIHLRPGVTFQDGEKLDAAAVKYTLERHLTMQGSFRRGEIGSIDHVEVVDPADRAGRAEGAVGAVSGAADRPRRHDPAAQGGRGGGQGFRPASGLRRPVQVRRARGAGPHHAGPLSRLLGRRDIHFDRVIYQPMLDRSVRLANLQRRHASTWPSASLPTDVAAVKQDPKLRIVTVGRRSAISGITFNLAQRRRGQHADRPERAVRQAFDAGDRPRRRWSMSCSTACTCRRRRRSRRLAVLRRSAASRRPRDVAKAKALLKQAGRDDAGRGAAAWCPTTPTSAQVGRGDPVDGERGRAST